ncbi:MAG: fumarylacetoacetate hydrolase family protein [Thermodesulfobacteriota bacterium]|jgi:2-keto-4-pentenoate hydratase/2-oxohepta-3-ene-1,7-dioic acid hydratase in catechol pathway
MKFVRYQIGERASYGIWEDAFIQEISGSIFGKFEATSSKHKISSVRLLPPAEPSKILCVGLNFRDHIEELGDEIPKFPSHFIKPLSAVIGPEDPILYPRVAQRVDYEGELALVIKNRVKDVSPEEALDHVLGYTCFNDVTERTLTKVQGQLTRSKGFDSFAPFGPCIATGLDPSQLIVRTFLNGKKVQEGHTRNLVFSVPFLIHYLSQCMTLFPGDIISTGTPKGIGAIKPGDVVEVSIEGIGTLRNPLQA